MTRALIISPLPPPDPARDHHGVYQRLRLFVQALASEHQQIDIGCFVPPGDIDSQAAAQISAQSSSFWGVPVNVRLLPLDRSARSPLQTLQAVFGVRYRGDFRPFLADSAQSALQNLLASQPDVIFAHRLPMMEALRLQTSSQAPIAPIILDLDDVEHLVKLRAAMVHRSGWRCQRLAFEAKALAAAEHRALESARLTFICSDSDRTRLSESGFDVSRLAVAPNAVQMPEVMPEPSCQLNALYIGNYGHPPNAEAAERLITLIWPQVRAALPQARLIIAGANPERIASFREEPDGVEFTGLVQDLDALYRRARIVCCPLLNGGGTRLKLIEAAGQGVAIAATQIAAEGLALRDGREIMLRDDDVGLAAACITLLTDEARARTQAEAAFRAVSQRYRPPTVKALIRAAMQQALSTPRDMPAPRDMLGDVLAPKDIQPAMPGMSARLRDGARAMSVVTLKTDSVK